MQCGSGSPLEEWKMISEDDEEVKCSMFPSSAAKFSEPDESIDESGQSVYTSNCGLLLHDFLVDLVKGQALKRTSGGQICLQLLGVG